MLANREQAALHTLSLAHQATLRAIQPRIDHLMQQYQQALQGGAVSPSWLYEMHRLEAIKALIEQQMNGYGTSALQYVKQLQQHAAGLGQQAGMTSLQATLPPGIHYAFGMPDPGAIVAIVGQTKAGPLSDLFNGFGSEAAQKAGQALVSGITLGDNPNTVAKAVADALQISWQRAATIARTEMLNAYRMSNLATFQANSDVVDQWRWTCALSSRTCAACLAMDGTLHSLDESMDSHPCCRCTQTPVTKPWSDILSGTSIDVSDIPDTPSPTDWQTGADWFAAQPASVQQDILGKAAYQLYANGEVDLQDFVSVSTDTTWGKSIYQTPVKELQKK
jgi:SPP1 gp7 family putative phage head morphogenesis protein